MCFVQGRTARLGRNPFLYAPKLRSFPIMLLVKEEKKLKIVIRGRIICMLL